MSGLCPAPAFADFGHHVTCVDKDAEKIARLRKGEMPVFEPDLDRLVVGWSRPGGCSQASSSATVADALVIVTE
jgi:UDPglucose 6-dehydrogenase